MRNLKIKIAVIALVLFVCPPVKSQSDKKIFALEQNKPTEQEIAAGQTHSYEIKADKEQFLHIVIDQKSVNTRAALFSPDGRKLLEVDNPNIARGPEQIFFVTPAAGTHRVEINSKETGRYQIKIEALRAAAPADRIRLEAEIAFIEGERLSASSAYEESLAKYEEAFRLINNSGDRYGEATILYSLGKTHGALGEKEKAADYLRRSLALFQTAGSWDEVFKDLSPLYLFMGGKQQTFDYLADALPLVRALKNQRLEAILLAGLAKVSEDMNQPEKALDYNSQALALLRVTGKRGAEVFTLTEIADGDLSLEDKKKAIGYLNQALMLARGASDKALEANLLFGIGYIYGRIDEREKALDYFGQTLPIWRELKDKNGEAYALYFISGSYFSLGDAFLARDYLEQSLPLFQETGDARAQAQAILFLGALAYQFGDSQRAFDYYQKALRMYREKGDKNGEASALEYLTDVYWMRGDRQKVLELYQESLSIWREIKFREGEANTLLNIGFVFDSFGNIERSLDYYNQALPLFRLLGSQSSEAWTLYGIARVMSAKGKPDEALANTETAINIVESIRTKIAGAERRATFLATYQNLYQFYIDLLMRLDQNRPSQGFDARALQASERARARSLLDLLNESRADLRQGVEPALFERQKVLQKQLNVKAEEKRLAKNAQQSESLDREIRRLTADYQTLQAEIKLKSPRYAALTQPQPAGLKEIQQMLDADTLLLEYSLGEERSFLWVVSQDELKTFVLPKREAIENQARSFYESVKDTKDEQKTKKAAADLSKIVIEPAAAELGNKRLLIVADGALHYIPFAALRSPNSKTGDRFLIENHEIVYVPSASALASLRDDAKERKPPPKTLAVIADPVFDASDTRVDPVGGHKNAANSPLKAAQRDVGFNNALPLLRLPKTREEAITISALVPDAEKKRAIDFEASRAIAVSQELSQYRIIHFATHGLLNSQHPELSGIVLSLVDEKGKPQDGFLRLHEIYNLRLPADLIVLSACQTALGKEIRGEGLIGLTRGFMYAGALRVAASLWLVDDRAASELMKSFYQGMLGEKRLRPTAALREAQIAILKNKRFAAPYYWAAFTIQGDWR